MGFLERLRQEKEVREREAQVQAQSAKSLFNQQQESKRQAEVFHHNQRIMAEQTVEDSSIDALLDELDTSLVSSIKIIPYKGKYTYDILPYGDTGGYWANNILIGSTLSRIHFKTRHSDLSRVSKRLEILDAPPTGGLPE